MAFSAAAETSILALIFNATNWANFADNTATSPLTALSLGLHTASPASGTQSTSEATYTGYARESVARTSAGFTVSGASATLTSTVNFPAGTAGSDTISYFSVGVATSGATAVLISGTVAPNITTGNGITPQLTSATTITLS